jgi:hypothetical protein
MNQKKRKPLTRLSQDQNFSLISAMHSAQMRFFLYSTSAASPPQKKQVG